MLGQQLSGTKRIGTLQLHFVVRFVDPYPARCAQATNGSTPSRWPRPFVESRRSVASWDHQRSRVERCRTVTRHQNKPCESQPIVCLMFNQSSLASWIMFASNMDRGSLKVGSSKVKDQQASVTEYSVTLHLMGDVWWYNVVICAVQTHNLC